MSTTDQAPSFAHLFESGIDAELQQEFASGQGVVELHPEMTDAMLLTVVKFAIANSGGKPFLVVPAVQS